MLIKLIVSMVCIYGAMHGAAMAPSVQSNSDLTIEQDFLQLAQTMNSVDRFLSSYRTHLEVRIVQGKKPTCLPISLFCNEASCELTYSLQRYDGVDRSESYEACNLKLTHNYLDQAVITCTKKAFVGSDLLPAPLVFGSAKVVFESKKGSVFTMTDPQGVGDSKRMVFSPLAEPEDFGYTPIAALLIIFQQHLKGKNEVVFHSPSDMQNDLFKILKIQKYVDSSIAADKW